MYGFVRSRQLEGTFPGKPSTGTWISTAMRVSKGWGILDEKLWPYDGRSNHWPPSEPKGVDSAAKTLRISAYQRACTPMEFKALLNSNNIPVVALEIDDSWSNPAYGVISVPGNSSIIGSHAVDLLGYNDNKQLFTFKNSWGESWGDAGYGYLPYSYFPSRFLEGWAALLNIPNPPFKKNSFSVRNWGGKDLFGDTLHAVEIVDSVENEMIAWAFAIEAKPNFLNLQELFVRPKWRQRGYASQLITECLRLAHVGRRQIRAWIPHSDIGASNQPALNAVLRRLGLSRNTSPVRWAAALAA